MKQFSDYSYLRAPRRIGRAIVGCVLLSLASLPVANAATGQCFQIFDATVHPNKPDLTPHGIRPAYVVYGIRQLWQQNRTPEALAELPPQANVEAVVSQAVSGGAPLIVIDVEHWPNVGTDDIVAETLRKYLQLGDWSRTSAAGVPVSYYGLSPLRDYWRAIKQPETAEYRLWQAENDRLQPLAVHMDALTPSLYTFYDDVEGWKRYAAANVREARRLAPEKPLYPFIWPQYHNSNAQLSGQYLSYAYWTQELRTLEQITDGVVIWNGSPAAWDPNAAWWQATLDFIATSERACRPESEPQD